MARPSDTDFCRLVQQILENSDYGGDQIRHTYGIIDKLNKHFWYERLVSIALKSMEDTERRITITKSYLEAHQNSSIDWAGVFNEISIAVEKNIERLEQRNKEIWSRNMLNYDARDPLLTTYNENVNYFLIYTDNESPAGARPGTPRGQSNMYDFDPNNFLWSIYTHLLLGQDGFKHYKLYLPTNTVNSAKVEIPRCGPLIVSLPCCVLRHQILPGFEGYKVACAAMKPITVLVDQAYAGVRRFRDSRALNVSGYGCHKFVKIATLRCPTYYDLYKQIGRNKDICKKYVMVLRVVNIADNTIYLQTRFEPPKKSKQYKRLILKEPRCLSQSEFEGAARAHKAYRDANPDAFEQHRARLGNTMRTITATRAARPVRQPWDEWEEGPPRRPWPPVTPRP